MMTADELRSALATRTRPSLVLAMTKAGLPTDHAWTLVHAAEMVRLSEEILASATDGPAIMLASRLSVEAEELYRLLSGRLLGAPGVSRSDEPTPAA